MSKKKKVVLKTTPQRQKKGANLKTNASRNIKITSEEIVLNNHNIKWMVIGAALVLLGMILMLGGSQASPDVWDPSVIYSTRITILAPLVIVAGLAVEVYAIFIDKK